MQQVSDQLRLEAKKIGFVPTMGFLHKGHLSLISKSKNIADITVVSIFVNPTQFAPNEDFNRYPRDIDSDKKILEELGVDYLFLPSADDIYPFSFQTFVTVEELSKIIEGEYRPTHFKGVTTIVNILFNCVKPHFAIFGQKDAQQAAIIKQMVNDLKMDVVIVVEPMVRESDGLAMSSRNVYLSEEERNSARLLYSSLLTAEKFVQDKEIDPERIKREMKVMLSEDKNIRLDYIKIVNADTFNEALFIEEGNVYYVLIAVRIGKTRLIDNILVRPGR
jgi:pantoate--beta-alanine ligase